MYRFKKDEKENFLQGRTITYIANIIGITREHLTNIFNRKIECSKLVAFCIVKSVYPNKEITDFFEFVEKGE